MRIHHLPSPEKFRVVQEFLPQFTKLCRYYVFPFLFWELPLNTSNPKLYGATVTFINTGKKSFGITNMHVYEKYIEMKSANKNTRCQIGKLEIDLESRIIDKSYDPAFDLVTFEITKDEQKILSVEPLYHKFWPVHYKENEIEPVFILGFPGHLREINTPERIIASFGSFMVTIKSISNDRISIVFDRENQLPTFKDKPVEYSRMRGFSGAGIFRVNNMIPELLGIVTDHAESYDILLGSRSDLIMEDGRITKNVQ